MQVERCVPKSNLLIMYFLANPNSKHLNSWIELYEKCSHSVTGMYTIHDGEFHNKAISVNRFFVLNKIFSYIWLGLFLRFIRIDSNTVYHAHGASGYGLSAFLSGRDYIVTVYGSEIFAKHNFLYTFLVKLILSNAKSVTVTSDFAKVKVFDITGKLDNIHCFHTGINFHNLSGFECKKSESATLRFLSVRNCAPVYRTEDVIKSFLSFKNEFVDVNPVLTVILGNGDKTYFCNLKSKFEAAGVVFLEKILEHNELVKLISESDVCISFPESDQMSSTVLEVLYLGKYLISSELASYNKLYDALPGEFVFRCSHPDELKDAMLFSVGVVNSLQSKHSLKKYLESKYSVEIALVEFKNVLAELQNEKKV